LKSVIGTDPSKDSIIVCMTDLINYDVFSRIGRLGGALGCKGNRGVVISCGPLVATAFAIALR
jgi:hypothetical protein